MAELTGIFSDIMNLKDRIGFSDSWVLPQQVKTRSVGYLGHGEKELGDCRTRTAGGAAPVGER